MSDAPPAPRGRVAGVVLGCLVCQLGLGFGYVFGALAGDVLAEFDWSRSAYSAFRTPQLVVTALVSPAVGWLTIRFGARRILLAATLVVGAAFGGLGRLGSLAELYALTMVMGFGLAGIGDVTVGHLVASWVQRRRGLALGLVYTGSNLGGAAVVPLAAAVADAFTWREAFFAIGAVAVLGMWPIAYLLVREPPVPAGADREETGEAPQDGMRLREAWRTRSFWILAFVLFAFFFYFLGVIDHLVLHLTDGGLPRNVAAAQLSSAIGLGIAGKLGMGLLADRLSPRRAAALDFGLLFASSLVLFALPIQPWLAVFVATYGLAAAARDVVYPLLVADCFGSAYLAEVYGGLMLALLPGGALGSLFAAAVHDATGSYQAAFATFAVLNGLALASLTGLRDETRHR